MPGCSAYYCTNSSSKGFKMCHFPSNPERRQVWLEKIGRKNWTPTANATLCEIHFEPSMWEKPRVDGKTKLKCNAVPTLFVRDLQNEDPMCERVKDAIEFLSSNRSRRSDEASGPNESEPVANRCETLVEIKISNNDQIVLKKKTEQEERLEKLEKIFARSEKSRKLLKNRLRAARMKIKKLEKELELAKNNSTVENASDYDQFEFLDDEDEVLES